VHEHDRGCGLLGIYSHRRRLGRGIRSRTADGAGGAGRRRLSIAREPTARSRRRAPPDPRGEVAHRDGAPAPSGPTCRKGPEKPPSGPAITRQSMKPPGRQAASPSRCCWPHRCVLDRAVVPVRLGRWRQHPHGDVAFGPDVVGEGRRRATRSTIRSCRREHRAVGRGYLLRAHAFPTRSTPPARRLG
jgi:hypothetical protein